MNQPFIVFKKCWLKSTKIGTQRNNAVCFVLDQGVGFV